MVALSITRTDLTVEQLRAAAVREVAARTARRILAIAMVLAGHSRQVAAEAQAMVLRDNQGETPDCRAIPWSGKRCATGSFVIISRVSRAWRIDPGRVGRLC